MIVRKVGQGMIVRLVGIRIPGYEPGIREVIDGKLCIYARWDRK